MHARRSQRRTLAKISIKTEFDLIANLCMLNGQAVMRESSDELKAETRVLLDSLGREIAARLFEKATRRPSRRRRPLVWSAHGGAQVPNSCTPVPD